MQTMTTMMKKKTTVRPPAGALLYCCKSIAVIKTTTTTKMATMMKRSMLTTTTTQATRFTVATTTAMATTRRQSNMGPTLTLPARPRNFSSLCSVCNIRNNNNIAGQSPCDDGTKTLAPHPLRMAGYLMFSSSSTSSHSHRTTHYQQRQQRGMTTSSASAPSTAMAISNTDQILMEILHQHHGDSVGDGADNDASCNIVKITLNRPKANAMGKELMQGFQNILSYLEQQQQQQHKPSRSPASVPESAASPSISLAPRCVVITSSSSKVFCAGADLKERSQMTDLNDVDEYVTMLRSTLQRLSQLTVPVIASVGGIAVGGGLELALAADIRICSSGAKFGAPEAKLAIIPGAGGTQRLPRVVGVSRAKELIWTGRQIDAHEAFRIGLVEEVVDTVVVNDDQEAHSNSVVDDRAIELAFHIARNAGPVAVRASKEAIDRGLKELDINDALEIERECYAKTLTTRDRLEGLAAFKEGRSPIYKGC